MREAVLRDAHARTLARAFRAHAKAAAAVALLTAGSLLAGLPRASAQDTPPAPAVPAAPAEAPDGSKRLADLERRLDEQQREIDSLRATKGPRAPDEKGSVAAVGSHTPAEPQFQWGYDEGFFVETKIHDAKFKLRPRGGIQLDYRAYPHETPSDQFVLRRAKVGFEGSFADFNFDIEVQPLRATIPFVDAWFEWAPAKEFKARFGHFKTPFSLDNGVTLDFRTDFVERPMVIGSGNAVAPDYHPGAEILGTVGEGLVSYWLSVQNIPDSATVLSGDPLVAARLETTFAGLTLGGAGYWERLAASTTAGANGPVTVYPTSFGGFTPGQFQWFKPVSVHGWTQAYELDACFYMGPLWARGEYVYAVQERARVLADHTDGTGLVTQGTYGTLGFVFWGPAKDKARPEGAPFRDWELFSWSVEKKKNKRFVGAELVCRVEWVGIDDERDGRKGQGGKPATTSTAANADKVKGNQAAAVWVGLNLSPIENVELMADWVHIRTGDQSRAEAPHHRREGDEFLLRAQLDF